MKAEHVEAGVLVAPAGRHDVTFMIVAANDWGYLLIDLDRGVVTSEELSKYEMADHLKKQCMLRRSRF